MDENQRSCSFYRAQNDEEFAATRCSKYLQADSRGVYELVKADLDSKRRVIFSGTPCQVNALALYLGERRDELLLIDCVCHGVPSPKLWAESIKDIESQNGKSINYVNFRFKEASWKQEILNKKTNIDTIYQTIDESPYMRMFLKNYCLRPSCYECQAKSTRKADITIGDFWGIANVIPRMEDDLGCSLIIVRTDVGINTISSIAENLDIQKVSYEDAVRDNKPEYSSVNKPLERDQFYKDLDELGYAYVKNVYGKQSIKEFLKKLIKGVFEKAGLLKSIQKIRGTSNRNMKFGLLFILKND